MRRTCDGLVIRQYPYGENDVIITLLTADEGKIVMSAKGARSMRSRISAICSLFTYANVEYYTKNGRQWLSGGSVVDSFFGLNSDMQGFALACYIVQLVAEITGEGVPCPEILRMTLNTLYAIQNKLKPYGQIKSAYEIFAANVSGFAPDLRECACCGRKSSGSGWWLDIMNGRMICDDCHSKKSRMGSVPPTDGLVTQSILHYMDDSAVAAWRYVTDASLKRVFAFTLSDGESMGYLERASEAYIVNHLERGFETLDFYHTVKE